jgi:spartin
VASTEGITYSVPSPNVSSASLLVTLPLPASAADMEDLDSFEVLLRQYGSLDEGVTALADLTAPNLGSGAGAGAGPVGNEPLAEELRGRLVLINEDTGQVVGELEQSMSAEEDRQVAAGDKDKPVVLDFGPMVEGYAGRMVKVATVPDDEMDDWMLKGAHHIR